MAQLQQLAKVIRSKNSGPFEITFDVIFDDAAVYQRVEHGFFLQKLFRNDYVCIVRGDHPLIGEKISLKTYLAASHAVVSPDGREYLCTARQHSHRRSTV